MPACGGWERITSTCTRFIAGITSTPIEETLEALHDVVKAGKARYIGASSMYAWQFCKALHLADQHGWTRFVSMQNHYNLLYREEEREMLGLCQAEGIGVLAVEPARRGDGWRDLGRPSRAPSAAETDEFGKKLYAKTRGGRSPGGRSRGRNCRRRGRFLARRSRWPGCCSKPVVTSPIVGATKPQHLEDAVAALGVKLSPEEIAALEAPYVPHSLPGSRDMETGPAGRMAGQRRRRSPTAGSDPRRRRPHIIALVLRHLRLGH